MRWYIINVFGLIVYIELQVCVVNVQIDIL